MASSSPSGARARSADDDQPAVPAGRRRGADLLDVLFERDHSLPLEVAALLGPFLVLEDDARDALLHHLLDGPDHIQGIAVARIDVRYQR